MSDEVTRLDQIKRRHQAWAEPLYADVAWLIAEVERLSHADCHAFAAELVAERAESSRQQER